MKGVWVDKLHEKSLILATDLDGTFLGGTRADRRALYAWIDANRAALGLIFVTGRSAGFVEEITATGVPRPDYLIAELGGVTAAMTDGSLRTMPEMAPPMPPDWAATLTELRGRLDAVSGLTRDTTASASHLSYHVDRTRFDRAAVADLDRRCLSLILSDNRHLHLLPAGHGKGPALKRLLGRLGIGTGSVLVAGDSLNDLSMFTGEWPGIVVGGAETALVQAVRDVPGVYLARTKGAGGILEGLAERGLGPDLAGATAAAKD